jgi:hypothetical protein
MRAPWWDALLRTRLGPPAFWPAGEGPSTSNRNFLGRVGWVSLPGYPRWQLRDRSGGSGGEIAIDDGIEEAETTDNLQPSWGEAIVKHRITQ